MHSSRKQVLFLQGQDICVLVTIVIPIFLFLKQRDKAEEASLAHSYRSPQLYLHLPV